MVARHLDRFGVDPALLRQQGCPQPNPPWRKKTAGRLRRSPGSGVANALSLNGPETYSIATAPSGVRKAPSVDGEGFRRRSLVLNPAGASA